MSYIGYNLGQACKDMEKPAKACRDLIKACRDLVKACRDLEKVVCRDMGQLTEV